MVRCGQFQWCLSLKISRGLPYETIQFDFRHVAAGAVNVSALVRWDSAKRRAKFHLETPLGRQPGRRLEFTVDGRDESCVTAGEAFMLQWLKGLVKWRWQISHRRVWLFGINASGRRIGKNSNHNGFLLTYENGVAHRLLNDSKRRLQADVDAST